MLEFSPHLICLLVELLYLNLSRPYVPLQLLYLVVQHKLELFQLLCLFLQLEDPNVFLTYGRLSFHYLTLLGLFLLSEVPDLGHDFIHAVLLIVDFLEEAVSLGTGFSVQVHCLSEVVFVLHASFDDFDKLNLGFLFQFVYLI